MSDINTIDDFLGHNGSGGGGRGKYLKNWKKDGSLRFWLHTKQLPVASWKHQIPDLVVFDDRDTKETTKAFWGKDKNCWESEKFLRQQYARDPDGSLDISPNHCSICRLIDVVAKAIAKGELDWTDEVFRFEGATESKNNRVVHAGGLTNLFSKKNITPAEKSQLKSKGILLTEAWGENFHAKCQYVLTVVDNDDIGAGVQIASQPQSVGDHIKRVINDVRASLGEEEGNPLTHPYCIELTYDEKAHMSKKYGARRIERIKLTPEIERLIYSDPPELAGSIRPFNQTQMRAFLERYATVDLPWDYIFEVPKLSMVPDDKQSDPDMEFPPKETKTTPKSFHQPPTPMQPKQEAKSFHQPPVTKGRRVVADEPVPPPSPKVEEEIVPCDKCEYPMKATDTVCPDCGTTYELEGDEPAPKTISVEAATLLQGGSIKGDKLPFGGSKPSRF